VGGDEGGPIKVEAKEKWDDVARGGAGGRLQNEKNFLLEVVMLNRCRG